jgi:hypothetical protein
VLSLLSVSPACDAAPAPGSAAVFLTCACCGHAVLWCAVQNGRVAATPRQLEAMIRISEALARMHLRTEVRGRLRHQSSTHLRPIHQSSLVSCTCSAHSAAEVIGSVLMYPLCVAAVLLSGDGGRRAQRLQAVV